MSQLRLDRRKLLKTAALVGAGTVAAGTLSGCKTAGGDAGEAETKEEINVVGIFPLSGFIAADGEEMRNGAVMAIDEINELGGIGGRKLKYIEIDDVDSVGDQVTTAFNRAIDVEKADVIFSGYHLTSAPEFDICADGNTLYYNNNTQKAWTDRYQTDPEKYWSIFQTDPNEEWYGGGFAEYLNLLLETGQFTPDEKTAAILHGDDTYSSFIGNTFNERAQELGWTITLKETFTVGNVADWGPMLSQVRDNPPAVLFTVTYNPADNAAMANQLAENPLPSLVYQQYGPSVPEYLELTGANSNGIIWGTVLGFLPDEIGLDWVKAYEAKFGTTPGYANAPGGYDGVWVWAMAAALAGDAKDHKKVAQMTEKNIYRGVTGGLSFVNHAGVCYPWQKNDPSLGQSHTIYQIQDGKQVLVFPPPYNNGDYQTPPWLA